MENNQKEWWKTTFNRKYIELYSNILTHDTTKRQVDFIINKLNPLKTDIILDAACGYGRHTIELAKRGYKVVGVDQSKTFIKIAKKNSANLANKPTFLSNDIRSLGHSERYDIIINLFTSFGYFSDLGNKLFLKAIAEALKPKGLFLIDVLNKNRKIRIMSSSKPKKYQGTLYISGSQNINGNIFNIKESFNPINSRWKSSVHKTGKQQWEYNTDVRLYTSRELKTLLREQDLIPIKLWGSFNGSMFDSNRSSRIICLAQKK